MKLYQVKDYEAMSQKAADLVAAQILLKPTCVLGLATGSSPQGLYRELVERNRKGILDFSQVRTVNLDEYKGLAADNDQSYRYFMQQNLFAHINIAPENTHLPNGLAQDEEAECARYDALIDALGGIDLQVLGIGANGHIGFNEPAEAFVGNTHCVALTESTVQANARFFASPDDVPRFAYTMGIRPILQARRIVLVVNGPAKADALRAALYGPITPAMPASILQIHPNVTVIADESAASRL